MAVIDVAGYVAELKDHATDHGFHVHDERHFVETYSLRQFWEVDLHPEEGCGGPIDLHLALEVDPRTLLDFEDAVVALPDDEEPPDKWSFPLTFNWGIPPLPNGPDLLRLAIDLAGVGGVELPLEISATDSFGSVTDPPVRRLTIVARHEVSLAKSSPAKSCCVTPSTGHAWSAGFCWTQRPPGSTHDRQAPGPSAPAPLRRHGARRIRCGDRKRLRCIGVDTRTPKRASMSVTACRSTRQSTKTSDAALAGKDRARALTLLREALQPAALAGSNDGDWQALMTTLSESNRVPESKLVPALSAQSAQSLSQG